MHIFMDESGELGFHARSSKHYGIACICTEQQKSIYKAFKNFNAFLIRNGWPKDVEPKANKLFNCTRDSEIPSTFNFKSNSHDVILEFLKRLSKRDFEIDAIIINKRNIDTHLKNAPFGIKHNYFAAQVLVPRIVQYDEVYLFVDQRSKERHSHLHFDGYIETRVFTERTNGMQFQIRHEDSRVVKGLSTVDYISWSIFRLFEYGDKRFFSCINGKVANLNKWYFQKRKSS